jgi:hypothetical protein
MKNKFMLIRVITVPPVFAAILLMLILILRPSEAGELYHILTGILCLTVLPLLAYPLQRFIPVFKDRGREGQRTLAMIFSCIGYVLVVATAYALNAPVTLKMIYWEYLLCGIGILISNKLIKIKASGHACGIVGPVVMLLYLGMPICSVIAALISVPVFVSSIKTRRHTVSELVAGSVIPCLMLVIVHIIFNVF